VTETVRRLAADSCEIGDVLRLIKQSFAYMDGRIDPPSSMHRLAEGAARKQAQEAEIWVIGAPIVACVFLTPQEGQLYLGKLAVRADMRGRGLVRRLVAVADARAQALGLSGIALKSRVELTENHAAFEAMGFVKTSEHAHEGYERSKSFGFGKDALPLT